MKLEATKLPHIYRGSSGMLYVRMFRREKKRELFRSLRTDKITDAKIKADRLIQEYLGLKGGNGRQLVADVWEKFLALHENKAETTYRSMEIQGRLHLNPFFGDSLIDEITEADWEKYITHARKATPGRKLFNDRKYFSMLFKYAVNAKIISSRPFFRNPDPKTKAGKVFSDDEVQSLLKNADNDLRLKILMAVTMGMRRGEVINLEWDRVDLSKATIHLRACDTKIRKERTFAISKTVLKALIARKRSAQSDWVFPSHKNPKAPQGEFRKSWATCKAEAEVKGRFHDLRHTFLTRAFKTSANPALICFYAGLSLEVAQKIYLHFDVEDARNIAEIVKVRDE